MSHGSLHRGAENRTEQQIIDRQLRAWKTKIIHTNEAVSIRATQPVRNFALSHSLSAMDALIAGTVIENDDSLLTANTKLFEYISGLTCTNFLPK
ncbi:MAG TPA: hypothetical protein DEB24_07845 [Coriobacteriia bacterium]|nr:hypothetical protein [Coriobacteriia bacterium]